MFGRETPEEMAQEMERVCQALAGAQTFLAGLDQADSARQRTTRVAYSPLRTLVEQAQETADRVLAYLRSGTVE
ncbi:hypothetical protein J2S41_005730 [Catenuloplanes atrovinosus]|uniref:Uncharacterized protein n=1 Tax=Catenuloplanes atrovinosus TaxID=137266 RepID=A0AAE4CC85_9ACTN|nr:hypothetical protein [Catenuloplanes atrovinosus]